MMYELLRAQGNAIDMNQLAKSAKEIRSALLLEINRRFGTPIPPDTEDVEDLSPLVMPVDAEFRVGTMGLGWDSEAETVVVELLAVSETEFDASVVLDDAEEGPDAVRVFLTPESARQFAARSNRVISAGRPPCPLCEEPLDPVCVHRVVVAHQHHRRRLVAAAEVAHHGEHT